MKYLTSIFALLFGAFLLILPGCSATPFADNCAGTPSIAGYCTPLTYKDTTGNFAASPTTGDCQNTCIGVNTDAGDWAVDFSDVAEGGRKSLLLYPCGFAVARGDGMPHSATIKMTNQDILDLYEGSIKRFGGAHGGKISAEGTMTCGSYNVKWYIQKL